MTTQPGYRIGVGIADITGEAGGAGMMGYAMPQQRTAGIHLRQWARAFVIAEPGAGGNRVVFVNNDLGMVFSAVHAEVLRRLAAEFGDRYTAENTILSATHTHSGPGGFSHYTLYNITTAGFRPKTFEAIVSGIVSAIRRADADVAPGEIRVNTGQLFGANINRSLPAFQRNPRVEQAHFPGAVDPNMTVLRFERNGTPIGVLSWFATHGTSMPNTNQLISSDNKGYAAWLWENSWSGRTSLDKATGRTGFVAGFAQGNAGDMSPNLGPGEAYGPTGNYFANARVIGERQALKTQELLSAAAESVSGPIEYRQRFVDFSHIQLSCESAIGLPTDRTWPAVIGQAFMAGTHDGRGVELVQQGDLRTNPLTAILQGASRLPQPFLAKTPAEVAAGHSPKPCAIATGMNQPPWTPQILPLQIVKIGQLAIIAAPGEFTITSGHRVRAAVATALADEVSHLVFAGYANAYSGYVTTPEEYQAQLYEGASTHFGPATLPAYQEQFAALASALAAGRPTPSLIEPPELSASVWSLHRTAVPDVGGKHPFGTVIKEPQRSYLAGETVSATFHSAHPNNFVDGHTFLAVQRQTPAGWSTVTTDDDWRTIYRWSKVGRRSRATVSWSIPVGIPSGTYRLAHYGSANTENGLVDFTGTSRSFNVSDCGDADSLSP